jgi:hypothetical protein
VAANSFHRHMDLLCSHSIHYHCLRRLKPIYRFTLGVLFSFALTEKLHIQLCRP